jgi:hypothetical protein
MRCGIRDVQCTWSLGLKRDSRVKGLFFLFYGRSVRFSLALWRHHNGKKNSRDNTITS